MSASADEKKASWRGKGKRKYNTKLWGEGGGGGGLRCGAEASWMSRRITILLKGRCLVCENADKTVVAVGKMRGETSTNRYAA